MVRYENTEGVVTEDFAVHIPDSSHDPMKIAKRHGFVHVGQLGPLEGHHHFQRSADWTEQHPDLADAEEIAWFEQQIERLVQFWYYAYLNLKTFRRRFKRDDNPSIHAIQPAEIHDPLYGKQWHLHGHKLSINVEPVYTKGFTGKGINIAIVDDGLDYTNHDFQETYFKAGSYDVNYNKVRRLCLVQIPISSLVVARSIPFTQRQARHTISWYCRCW